MPKPKINRKTAPAANSTVAQESTSARKANGQESPETADHAQSSTPARPGGKLGLIVDRLATEAGVTADELVGATGWQKHTVFGALSRLRARGFAMQLDALDDRRAYRLKRSEG